jgi:hypothetical protein
VSRAPFYKPCPTGADTQPTIGIEGPGVGLGYDAWYLFPENTFAVQEEAEKVARLMNLAYEEGQKAKAAEIRSALLCTG